MPFALVTGGNRGLGLEVCRQLVSSHKPVLLTARDAAQGKAAADSLAAAAPGVTVRSLVLDTSSRDSIDSLRELVAREYDQQIDLVVNNAGVLVRGTWDKQAFDSTLKTNTAGPVALSQALLPLLAPNALIIMVSSGLGAQANLSSDYIAAVQAADTLDAVQAVEFKPASQMGTAAPGSGAMTPTYSVAKALLNKATQLLAADEGFKARGIKVAATCPGWCRTDMGGSDAHRSAEDGARSILWPWLNCSDAVNGSFTRDGEAQAW